MSAKVVWEWTTMFDRLVAIEQEVHDAVNAPGLSSLEVVKAAVRVRRAHASLTSYEDHHELLVGCPGLERVDQVRSF
jgi:hypothetical protein